MSQAKSDIRAMWDRADAERKDQEAIQAGLKRLQREIETWRAARAVVFWIRILTAVEIIRLAAELAP